MGPHLAISNHLRRPSNARFRKRRWAVVGVGLALTLSLPASAIAAVGIRIANVDASGAPSIRLTVVTSTPSTNAPLLTENGQPVAGLQAQNPGQGKNVILAIDRSQSMRGQALRDATEAAVRFVARKLNDDQISVVSFASQTLFQTPFSATSADAKTALSQDLAY
jgi:von Willebrand factor type A domain